MKKWLKWKTTLLLALFLLATFLFWALGTSAGSKWTLRNMLAQVGGEIGAVEGTIWSGLKLERLVIDTPEVSVVATNARVQVKWLELFNRRLKVTHMEVGDLDIRLLPVSAPEPETDAGPFAMPGLPVTIEVDTVRVGRFALVQADGSHLPIGLSGFWVSNLRVNQEQASGKIDSLHISHDLVNSDLSGNLKITQLKSPWPLELDLQVKTSSENRSSPICLDRFLASSVFRGQDSGSCTFDLDLQAQGSADRLGIVLEGNGQGVKLDANTVLNLFAPVPLENAHLALALENGASLLLNAELKEKQGVDGSDRLEGSLLSNRLALHQVLAGAVPESLLTARFGFKADLAGLDKLHQLDVQAHIDAASRWNRLPLSGDINLQLKSLSSADAIYIDNAHIDLVQGRNKIRSSGGFGHADSRLLLDINLPELASLWPGLEGSGSANGEVNGSLAKHDAFLKATFAQSGATDLGKAPVSLETRLEGALALDEQGQAVWQGYIDGLNLQHANIRLEQQDKLALYFAPDARDQEKQWSVGASQFKLVLNGKPAILDHQLSEGSQRGWKTQGEFSDLTIGYPFVRDIQQALAGGNEEKPEAAKANKIADVIYDGNWSFQQTQTLAGTVNLQRTAGDSLLPLEVTIPLDFNTLALQVKETLQADASTLTVIDATGRGNKSSIDMSLNLNLDSPFPLRDGHVNLGLTDNSRVQLKTVVHENQGQNHADKISATLHTRDLALDKLLAGAVPQALLNADIRVDIDLLDQQEVKNVALDARFRQPSQWNNQPLDGHLKTRINTSGLFASPQVGVDPSAQQEAKANYENLSVSDTDIYLVLGNNRIAGSGGFGQTHSQLALDINAPTLASFWPDLPGSIHFNGVLDGNMQNHKLVLQAMYADGADNRLGKAPVTLDLELRGRWARVKEGNSWVGTLGVLDAKHAGIRLLQTSPLSLSLMPTAVNDQIQWTVGESALSLELPDDHKVSIVQEGAQGSNGKWQTKGAVKDLAISPELIDQVRQLLDPTRQEKLASTNGQKKAERKEVVLDADWNLAFYRVLLGSFNLKRINGTGVLPFATPVPLDFHALSLDITQQPGGEGKGDLIHLSASGQGEKSSLSANINADMLSAYYLHDADISVSLPDGSALQTQVTVTPNEANRSYRILGSLATQKLALGKLFEGILPPSVLGTRLELDSELSPEVGLLSAHVKGDVDGGSQWNNQKLAGKLDVSLLRQLGSSGGVAVGAIDPHVYTIPRAEINLTLGGSAIKSSGAFGQADDKLALSVNAPRFSDFWPGLPGSLVLNGNLDGSLASHVVGLKGTFSQGKSTELGRAPVSFDLGLKGFWGELSAGADGWKGTLERLQVSHAGFSANQEKPLEAMFLPAGVGGKPEWQLGTSLLKIGLPGRHEVVINQEGASGREGNWASKGSINRLLINPALVKDMQDALGMVENNQNSNGGIVDNRKKQVVDENLLFDLDWDLQFNGALAGTANLKRVGGDFVVPLQNPLALGLTQMSLAVRANPVSGTQSQVLADLAIDTRDKGSLTARVNSRMNGMTPDINGGTSVVLKGRLDDIAWLSAFTGELLDLGGSVNLDLTAQSSVSGQWSTSGSVTGDKVRVVQIDNGVRLLDGTLNGTFRNNEFVINSLHFPSVIRVMPTEWRTKQWIEENPPAQNGSMNITGRWNLMNSKGNVKVTLDHYPIVQRADRFAMVSGNVDIDASLPNIDIVGKVTADAGWASIDILGTVPSVDSDVVVLQPGQKEVVSSESTTNLNLDFTVDLGPRFYLVGMGLNSGLVGDLNIIQRDGRLTALGAFRTRGGAIEAYGQRLQIRRGRITFQGNIANPVLDIEAIRTGPEVEAGLRVVGTARRPRITLVSYPDVSEVEKLSWLIMGRGPDSNGGDIALLFSVGSSILGGGEPFYRQLGLDDVAVRTGDLGKSGSVLPEQTVASGLEFDASSNLATQFFVASKKFANGVTVSVEQALAGTGSVVKASYKLFKYITVDAKVGTTNGIEFVYRRFFRD
ncbi:translocation/assembly module TamB domain-containing protein [Advenella faeciporci]|uniref:translocation/assembly module TamB domain-containing protein n=1 Tax=Advenella faeciporci TaxID=797535 RepID=UPI0016785243|nr:translocation/assembly module TamB domain-containing protein [Advenella faeciporci]